VREHAARIDVGRRATAARRAWRFGIWFALTASAVAAAVLSAYSEPGVRRLALGGPSPAGAAAASPRFGTEAEMRGLTETVRLLAADRDRLLARLSTLERNVEDVTGAIPSHAVGERFPSGAGGSPAPAALADRPPAGAEAARPAVSPPPVVAIPNPQGPAASVATQTEFGIDLGSAPTIEALRKLWNSLKSGHDPLLEGLRPIVAVRDGAKPGTVELRLVAGPLANASVAARLCAALGAAGLTCQAAVFDGQRLALK